MSLVSEALDGRLDLVRRSQADGRMAISRPAVPQPLRQQLAAELKNLQLADVFAWDRRIIQMVVESGRKLPGDVPVTRTWLHSLAGVWWFGRDNTCFELLTANASTMMRRRCCALAFWPHGAHPDQLAVCGYSYEGAQEAGPDLVAALELPEGETLHDYTRSWGATRQEALDRAERILQKAGGAPAALLTPEGEPDANAIKALLAAHQGGLLTEADTQDATQILIALGRLATAEHLLRFFLAGALWLQQEIVSYRTELPDRHAQRRAARLQIDPTVRVVELRARRYETPPGEEGHSDVEWGCSWVVRGHWRKQPYKDGIRPIWIDPYVKGDTEKPLKGSDRVFVVRR